MMHIVQSLIILCWASLVTAVADLDSPQSLYKADNFLNQRQCAQNDFTYDGDYLGNHALNCVGTPALNRCYCRADLQSIAVSWLISAVSQDCSKNPVDISSATSIYLAYCTPKIAPADAAAATTSTSTSAAQTQTSIVPTETDPSAAASTTILSTTSTSSTSSQSTQTVTFTEAPSITATVTQATTRVFVGTTATSESNGRVSFIKICGRYMAGLVGLVGIVVL